MKGIIQQLYCGTVFRQSKVFTSTTTYHFCDLHSLYLQRLQYNTCKAQFTHRNRASSNIAKYVLETLTTMTVKSSLIIPIISVSD